jgi:hypothetical protein
MAEQKASKNLNFYSWSLSILKRELQLGCPFFSSENTGRFKKTVNYKKISEKFDEKSEFSL